MKHILFISMYYFKQPVRPGMQRTVSCTPEQNLFQVLNYPTPLHGATAPRGPGNPHYRGYKITIFRHTTLSRSLLDEWSDRNTDLYLTKYNTDKRQISMSAGGIRTHSPSKRQPADPRLRHHGHLDRLKLHHDKDWQRSVTCYFHFPSQNVINDLWI